MHFDSPQVISELQEEMAQQANKETPLPSRFTTHRQGSQVTIRDTHTRKVLKVGLCDYQGALAALSAFWSTRK